MSAFVREKIASVTDSGAGPPFSALNLMPKSPSGPPGLWLAERMMPPIAPCFRITQEAAGVESKPPRPTSTRENPLPAARRSVVCHHGAVEEPPVAADDQRPARFFGDGVEDRLHEILDVVGLPEDGDGLAQA